MFIICIKQCIVNAIDVKKDARARELNNERFVSKVVQAKIDEEKAKLEKYTQIFEQVEEKLG